MQQSKECKTLLLAGLILLTALCTTGQSIEESASPVIEIVPVQKPIYLTLQRAIESTLKNNIAIAVRRFDSRILQQDVEDKKSEFDHAMTTPIAKNNENAMRCATNCTPVQ